MDVRVLNFKPDVGTSIWSVLVGVLMNDLKRVLTGTRSTSAEQSLEAQSGMGPRHMTFGR